MIFQKASVLWLEWRRDVSAMAGVEAALIFPVMLILLLGVIDAGNAILANQKTIRASQVVADLIARKNVLSASDVSEAIEAGRLAFEPLDNSSFGVDIVSIRFNETSPGNITGEIVWRETENMTPAADPLSDVDALESADEGVVMVSVKYVYEPVFSGFIFETFNMNEVAFSRGRGASVVVLESP